MPMIVIHTINLNTVIPIVDYHRELTLSSKSYIFHHLTQRARAGVNGAVSLFFRLGSPSESLLLRLARRLAGN